MPSRKAEVERKTKETQIRLSIDLDGSGESEIDTGIGFFDHMLAALAKHGLFDLTIHAKGDLEVDPHHTVEDVGILLGKAISKALGDKEGLVRYGWTIVPMDEALVLTSLDISG
ncbi:MAG: imidazoleglycerol-phosphate dehydratase, partial [Armatimonadota bacterium]